MFMLKTGQKKIVPVPFQVVTLVLYVVHGLPEVSNTHSFGGAGGSSGSVTTLALLNKV